MFAVDLIVYLEELQLFLVRKITMAAAKDFEVSMFEQHV
jgi:hypothetical protein